jgi:NifB/MoaA-like Fe-S oxidoreductase
MMTSPYGSDKREKLKANIAELRRLIAKAKATPGYNDNEDRKRTISALEAVCARFELGLNIVTIN